MKTRKVRARNDGYSSYIGMSKNTYQKFYVNVKSDSYQMFTYSLVNMKHILTLFARTVKSVLSIPALRLAVLATWILWYDRVTIKKKKDRSH